MKRVRVREKQQQRYIQTLSEFLELHEDHASTFGHTLKFIQHFLFILRGFYTQKGSLLESVHSLYDLARDIRRDFEELSSKVKLTQRSISCINEVQKCLDEILTDLDFYRLDEKGISQNVIRKQQIENLIAFTAEKSSIPQKTHGTILLLDRNPNTQASLSFRLENEGHEVLVAKTSSEALNLVKENEVDLVIIDEFTLHLVHQELFDYCIDENNYAIIVVIGHADNSQLIATSFIKGAEDFIPKPVNSELLKARVLSALEKRQLLLNRLQKLNNIRQAVEEIEETMDNNEDAVMLISKDLKIENHNGKILDMFPDLKEEFKTENGALCLKDVSIPAFYSALFTHELLSKNYHGDADNHIKDVLAKLQCQDGHWTEHLFDGRVIEYKFLTSFDSKKVIVIKDSTKGLTASPLAYLAYYDSLTGIVNRQFFLQRLEQITTKLSKENFYLLLIDLDGFKNVNDTYGHEMGDWLLIQATQRIKGLLRREDFFGRLGGDEFTVILQHSEGKDSVRKIAERILCSIKEPFTRGRTKLTISASIGIANFPDDADNATDIIMRADQAMYHIKLTTKNGMAFAGDSPKKRKSKKDAALITTSEHPIH